MEAEPRSPFRMKPIALVLPRPVLPGLFFALLTLLTGFGLGIAFGVAEEAIRAPHKRDALRVRDTVYHGDDKAMQVMVDRAWRYYQRAHLHAGGIGATAVGLILVLGALGTSAWVARAGSLLLGLGGLGYSWFWFWVGVRAPGLGSSAAARESLAWLAMPSAGAVVLGTLVVTAAVARAWVAPPAAAPR